MTQSTTLTEAPADALEPASGQTPFEPLLPAEKKLIAWSLGMGVALLIVLLFAGRLLPAMA